MEQLASKLPTGVGYDWTGCPIRNVSPATRHLHCTRFRYCRVPVSGGAVRELVDSVLRMLVVPLGVIGALLAATFRGLPMTFTSR